MRSGFGILIAGGFCWFYQAGGHQSARFAAYLRRETNPPRCD
jgi:hypothetical protein